MNNTRTYSDRIQTITALRQGLARELTALGDDWASGEFRNNPKRQAIMGELMKSVENPMGFFLQLDKASICLNVN